MPFTPPPFARKFCDEDFAFRLNIRAPFDPCENFWWLEIGGDGDSLNKAEEYNRELIACAFGAWDYIKNSGKFRCESWELDWVGFLAGKRESRRYIGDYTLTQNDVEQATPFEDEVAYGGWSMDDHDPRGLFAEGAPNVQHPIRAPYPIPYRCLSSANVKNLFFAGRNISVTHMALSSTRVMATCALTGQAVGTACAIAVRRSISPRGVYGYIGELQQALRDDDCFLLHTPRKVSAAMLHCTANRDLPRLFLDGVERTLGDTERALVFQKGEPLRIRFREKTYSEVRRFGCIRWTFAANSGQYCSLQKQGACKRPADFLRITFFYGRGKTVKSITIIAQKGGITDIPQGLCDFGDCRPLFEQLLCRIHLFHTDIFDQSDVHGLCKEMIQIRLRNK